MKRKSFKILSFIIVVLMLLSIMTFPVIAEEGQCVQCGPYTRYCASPMTMLGPYTHTFMYQGYPKTCQYYGVTYATLSVCNYCGTASYGYGNHSHGWTGHEPGCGWANGGNCQL